MYTIHGTDQHGCTDSTQIQLEVIDCYIKIPNVFTPNSDGKNDVFFVDYSGLDDYSIWIYNRWGRRIFESNEPSQPWDGTIHQEAAPAGVYYYYIEAGDIHRSGSVTLLR